MHLAPNFNPCRLWRQVRRVASVKTLQASIVRDENDLKFVLVIAQFGFVTYCLLRVQFVCVPICACVSCLPRRASKPIMALVIALLGKPK